MSVKSEMEIADQIADMAGVGEKRDYFRADLNFDGRMQI
ncbi:hypothetical protein USDA257_c47910 [Sinorhizobium fredii USDA 257]|uniref:Uncharacterized protein n=1 Tax=Sinorhizobium fredii (strain USDA 257) TaxID=1185652 RepID=I3XBS0_SINF2|nr:hypothetical protein USDA257_c47910 [Sinorhizobium fredii USDA 257]